MCFPSKRQKDNFTDNPTSQNGRNGTGTKAQESEPPSSVQQPSAPVATSSVPTQEPPTLPPIAYTTESTTAMAPKVAIIIYSMYGHVAKSAYDATATSSFIDPKLNVVLSLTPVAESVKKGIEVAGGTAAILQVAETLNDEVLRAMHAPPKPDYPVISPNDLPKYDAFIFGIPTRYGNMPAQWKSFWDATGQLWASGGLAGKYASIFVSTAGPGGGQESTAMNMMSTLTHHGIIFVPLGYSHSFGQLSSLTEVHGGSPWGAGTYTSSDGSRQPSALELEVAEIQGKAFYGIVSKVAF